MEEQEKKPAPPDFEKPVLPGKQSKPIDFSKFEHVEEEVVEHKEEEGE